MKKIIALDIDGTLLNSKNEITEKTKNTLIKCQEMGHILLIASGRDPNGVKKFADILNFKKYDGLISNFNGGRISNYKSGQILFNHPLDLDLAKEILLFSQKQNLNYLIYGEKEILTNSREIYGLDSIIKRVFAPYRVIEDLANKLDFPPNKILFSEDPKKIARYENILRKKYIDKTNQVKSTPYFYELMPKGVDKGSSLEEVASYYGIDMKDTIAFGDEENDLTMIEKAGIGVAMGNASDLLKKKADFISKTNDEDGISYYLEKYLLNQ